MSAPPARDVVPRFVDVWLEILGRYGVLDGMDERWIGQLELTAVERHRLKLCAAAQELTAEQFARKALWQECRRHLPHAEAQRTPPHPPGFSG